MLKINKKTTLLFQGGFQNFTVPLFRSWLKVITKSQKEMTSYKEKAFCLFKVIVF
jgi:hypothetical protein